MNYQKIYNNLIATRKNRGLLEGYTEKHHILPKSLGGDKTDSNNLIVLTAREHFLAHFLLAKIYGGNQWLAIQRMRGNKGFYANSRLYEIARKNLSIQVSLRFLGKPKTEEQKQKMSASATGKPKSQEAIEKVRKALIGKKPSEKSLLALKAGRHLAWTPPAQKKKSEKTKGVPRPYAKNSRFSIAACSAGGKAGKGRKQTADQIRKRVLSRRLTLESQGRTA